MRRALPLLLAFLSISVLFLSCGYSSSGTRNNVSGLKSRAFVSQDVSGGNTFAGVEIVDTQTDLLTGGTLISAGSKPGMMVVTPNRNETLVFSSADLTLTIVNNAAESDIAHPTLPGVTQSMVVSPDSNRAYVAVPTAPVEQQSPGTVEVVDLPSGTFLGQVNIPAVTYLSISHNGNRILAFSSSADTTDLPCTPQVPCFLFLITPGDIGTQTNPVTPIPGFDHPDSAFFSTDDNTAYVVNCGAECGGTQASVQKLDLTTTTCLPYGACPPVPVGAASVATIVDTTMYLAGTPFSGGLPSQLCDGQTQAKYCGLLTVFDLPSMSVTNGNPILITDGYHDHIAMGANGQLFVGAHDCTEIQGKEIRGCLSIYNTQTGAVVIPRANGDVTGLQPIANRSVVYLVQNGELQIYDTGNDKLQTTQVDISGEAVDVVAVDQ